MWTRLSTPVRSTETYAEYLAMKKPQQDDLKDVGGFVGGALTGRRKRGCVTARDLVTLDLDNLPPASTDEVLRRVDALGIGACVYSTRKHCASAPRLRVVLPSDRAMPAEEYEPIARKLATLIQSEMTWFDPATFQLERLMYFPSACADGDFVFHAMDKPLFSADSLLSSYENWRDVGKWAAVAGEAKLRARTASKQGDPEAKQGVIGAFCRVYDIEKAMETFLPNVYTACDIEGRFTYSEGSTAGGAVLYDDGKFLYSHHATDPCGGVLVNAFDMVRLHKFGASDEDALPDTPTNRLPSYDAMCRLAVADGAVSGLIRKERYAEAVAEFAPVAQTDEVDTNWMQKLTQHPKTGKVDSTMDNVWIILENDPLLRGKFALNTFAGRGEVLGALPWNTSDKRRGWEDNDTHGLNWYMEKVYQITGTGRIDGALSLHGNRHAFNDVVTYLEGLTWDGVPRLDSLYTDYLGAEDTVYTRAVARMGMVGAVARALHPGTKFDCMTIIAGAQGIGKSTLLRTLSCGWFCDSIRTFEGKEASELLQGVWLVEVGELEAFNRTEVGRIKQFLSQQVDRFRAAYGRHVKENPRCCVFFGTTNESEFLRDQTGSRRFLPIDTGIVPAKKSVWADLPSEVDQIWAEAVAGYRAGSPLYLSGEAEQGAKAMQESHRTASVREGLVADYLSQKIPEDWQKWTLDQRRVYLAGNCGYEGALVDRERVCALEIWCEVLGGDLRLMKHGDATEINGILSSMAGWKRMRKTSRFGYAKVQRGFERPMPNGECL